MFLASRVPPGARKAFKNDATAGMLGAVMTGLTGPFVAVIARDQLRASELEMALLSMSGVAGSLLSLVWARLAQSKGPMRVAVNSWVAGRALFVLAFFAVTHSTFVALIAVINITAAIGGPAYAAIMREVYPDGDRARIMGYARVYTWCSALAVTAVASWLLGVASYRYVFPLAAVFGIASALVFGRIPTRQPGGEPDESHVEFAKGSIAILRDDASFRWFCAGIFVFGFANFLALPIYPIYQVDALGVRTQWAGVYSITAQLAMLVSVSFWGRRVDQSRPEKVVAVQAMLWTLIPLVYCLASEPWMLLPAMVVSGSLSGGIELSYLNGVMRFAPPARVAQYQALFAVLTGIRGIIAPYVGAELLRSGVLSMKQIFLLSAGLILVSVVIQFLGMRRHRLGQTKTT